MFKDMVKILCFTPHLSFKDQESLYRLFFISIFTIFALSGCMTSNKVQPLALKPPIASLQSIDRESPYPSYLSDLKYSNNQSGNLNVIDNNHSVFLEDVDNDLSNMGALALSPDSKKANNKCRIKDRFDRKAVLAYEWGYKRIALDIDGVNLNGSSNKGIKLEYKMNLQRKKNKMQKCRYKSKWQGLLGSGYNEVFVREKDTMWEELGNIKNKVKNYMDITF